MAAIMRLTMALTGDRPSGSRRLERRRTWPEGALARLGTWDWAFLAACALSVVLLAWLGRSTTFWYDDWVILGSPSREGWTLDALMLPHNDHWQLTQILVWKVLQATVGLSSHLPYLLPTLLAHVGAATRSTYWPDGRPARSSPSRSASLFLLLGTAGEVFFFAAAFNLVAATALGTWALVVALPDDALRPHRPTTVDRRRRPAPGGRDVRRSRPLLPARHRPSSHCSSRSAPRAVGGPAGRPVLRRLELRLWWWRFDRRDVGRRVHAASPRETTCAPASRTPWARSPDSRTRSA